MPIAVQLNGFQHTHAHGLRYQAYCFQSLSGGWLCRRCDESKHTQQQWCLHRDPVSSARGMNSPCCPFCRKVGHIQFSATLSPHLHWCAIMLSALQARMHMQCSSLPGAQLEQSGGAGTAGSHLEDYLFYGCAT